VNEKVSEEIKLFGTKSLSTTNLQIAIPQNHIEKPCKKWNRKSISIEIGKR
tara:strand:+ start:869 stop:1021 length:153 start_codon:yes stop_codon:yes gene_type:complete